MDLTPDSTRNDVVKIQIGLVVLASFALAVSFVAPSLFWGLTSLSFFPAAIRIAIFCLLVISILPPVSRRLGEFLAARLERLTMQTHRTLFLLAGIILMILFVVLSSRNHLLGDGYLIMGNLATGQRGSPFELLTRAVIGGLFGLAGGGETAALWVYRLVAYASGAIFLIALWHYTSDKLHLYLLLPALLCFGVVQFFFGYVENYTLSFVFVFLYLLSATRDLEARRVSVFTGAFLLLAIGFHLQSGVLAPSFLYLLHNRYRSRKLLVTMLVASVVVLTAALLYAQSNVQVTRVFVPLLPAPTDPYHLFAASHFLDLFNLLMLAYPLVIALQLTDALWKVQFRWFHLLAIGGTVLFTVFVDPKLGAVRDWDMMSLAAAPLMLVTILVIRSLIDGGRAQAFRLFAPMLIFALLHTGSWVALNTSKEKSYVPLRAAIRADPHYSPEFDKGFRNVPWTGLINDKMQDFDEAISRMRVRLQAEPADEDNRYRLATLYLQQKNDPVTAVNLVTGHWRGLLDKPQAISDIGVLLARAKKFDEMDQMFSAFIAFGGVNYQVFYNFAVIKEARGDPEGAWQLYTRAFQLRPDAPIDHKLNFYLYCIRNGRAEIGVAGIREAIPKLSESSRSLAENLLQALRRRDTHAFDSLGTLLLQQPL